MNGTSVPCPCQFMENPCDACCQGLTVETPQEIVNRPGLSAVAYRVRTHARFKRSMLARLSCSKFPALQRLTTRENDDFAISLLDAAATVGDVLTFYQERIANECYLRTATERLSILHLARLIGYELKPGAAANTRLAFTVDDAKGAPGYAIIDARTKVQSVPGPGEQPQTFETTEKIEARAEWNTLRPALTEPRAVEWWKPSGTVYFTGTDTGLKPGDMLLFVTVECEQAWPPDAGAKPPAESRKDS